MGGQTVASLAAATGVSTRTITKRAKLVQTARGDTDLPWPDYYLHSSERHRILTVKRKVAELRDSDY